MSLAATSASPLRTRRQGLSDAVRTYRTALSLGWKTESNWTDPTLFLIYSLAKPIASVLILVFMLQVIAGGAAPESMLQFVVVGSALWAFVFSGIAGLAWSVLDDRERYRMLKYLYVSPNSLIVVMLGRATARIAAAAMGAVITLGLGVLFLGVRFDFFAIDWVLLTASTVLGLIAIIALGVVLAAVCMQTRQESWSYPEAVAGAMFLLVGPVFPLYVLPPVAQAIGLMIPLTWWLEGTRSGLFPGGISAIGGQGSLWTSLTGTE